MDRAGGRVRRSERREHSKQQHRQGKRMGFSDRKAQLQGKAPTAATSAAATRAAAPGASKAGRYSGLRMKEPRPPRPANGNYRLEIIESSRHQSKDPNGKADEYLLVRFKVLNSDNGTPVGAERSWVKSWTRKTYEQYALPELLAFVVRVAGFEDQEEFEATHPDWEDLFDAFLGTPTGEYGENPLAGATVDAEIVDSKNTDKEGKPYADWHFMPATDESESAED